MQIPRLRTIYRQRKWSLPAPVHKIMAVGRKIMPLGVKCFTGASNAFPTVFVPFTVLYSAA